MAGIALAGYILALAVVVAAIWLFVRTRRARPMPMPAHLAPAVAASRRRAFVAVLFAVVVLFAGVVLGISSTQLLGVPIAIASLVAGACGLLLYAATPPRAVEPGRTEARAASLSRRSALSVAPRRDLWAAAEVAVLFIAAIVLLGLLARPDDAGRSRAIGFATAETGSWASPFPGWFYGIPALIAFGLLAVATLVALHRIGSTAAFPDPADAALDLAWRRNSASVVLKLAVGSALFALGGFAVFGGPTMRNAVIDGATPVVWSILADALSVFGILFLVLSVVSVTLAALNAFTIGERIAGRVTSPAGQRA